MYTQELVPKTPQGDIDWERLPSPPSRPRAVETHALQEPVVELSSPAFRISMQAARPEFQGQQVPFSAVLVRILAQMEVSDFHAALARADSSCHDRAVVDIDEINKRRGWPNWAPEFILIQRTDEKIWRVISLEIAKVAVQLKPQVFPTQKAQRNVKLKQFYRKLDAAIQENTSATMKQHYLTVRKEMGAIEDLGWQYLTMAEVQ